LSQSKEEARSSVHEALGVRWYHTTDAPRTIARERTLATGIAHFVVALDYGDVTRSADGTVRRAGVVSSKGDDTLIGSKMFLPFHHNLLATFVDDIRMNPAYGPSCLNLYEEVNTDRPRRVGFDLEFELGHTQANGTRDHEVRGCAPRGRRPL
jgi:hypothetical protein